MNLQGGETWREILNLAFSYTGEDIIDIAVEWRGYNQSGLMQLLSNFDKQFYISSNQPEAIQISVRSKTWWYKTWWHGTPQPAEVPRLVVKDSFGKPRLFVYKVDPPTAAPKLNTWRKVFEAAFGRTGESWDIFQNPFGKFLKDAPALGLGSLPLGLFDAEFGKPFHVELPKGWEIGCADEARFSVTSKHFCYCTYQIDAATFIVGDDEHYPRLYVKYIGAEANPLDNPTPLGITREEVEELIAKQTKITELGSRRNYHMSEAIKTMKQMLELQGDHNNGD